MAVNTHCSLWCNIPLSAVDSKYKRMTKASMACLLLVWQTDFLSSYYLRAAEQLRLEDTSEYWLVLPHSSRDTYRCLPRTTSRHLPNISKEDTPQPPGQPVPALCHPHSTEGLPSAQTDPPVIPFLPIASCLILRHHWQDPGTSLSAASLQVSIPLIRSPPAFLSPRWTVPALSAFPNRRDAPVP